MCGHSPSIIIASKLFVAACHSLLHCPGVDLCMGGLCHVPCTGDGSEECIVGQICTSGGVCGFKCTGTDNLCPHGTVCHKGKCEQAVSLKKIFHWFWSGKYKKTPLWGSPPSTNHTFASKSKIAVKFQLILPYVTRRGT